MSAPFQLLVEGWRGIAHSYALVNQYHCLELLRCPGLVLHHRDKPFFGPHWRASGGVFSEAEEAALAGLPRPAGDTCADAVLRIAFPYDFSPAQGRRLIVFGTAENLICPPNALAGLGGRTLAQALDNEHTLLLTPSEWSRRGFLNSGAPASKVVVIPHGADLGRLKPPEPAARAELRARLGLGEEHFAFLNIGSLTSNKGADLLLRTFVALAKEHPRARLILKCNASLYPPSEFMLRCRRDIPAADQSLLQSRLIFLGAQYSLDELASLYQAADAYVAPYFAEGFNLPALEACACGLPVVCTARGATDEFLPADAHLPVASTLARIGERQLLVPDPDSLFEQMRRCLTDATVRQRAAETGPRHVREHYSWKRVTQSLLELCRNGSLPPKQGGEDIAGPATQPATALGKPCR